MKFLIGEHYGSVNKSKLWNLQPASKSLIWCHCNSILYQVVSEHDISPTEVEMIHQEASEIDQVISQFNNRSWSKVCNYLFPIKSFKLVFFMYCIIFVWFLFPKNMYKLFWTCKYLHHKDVPYLFILLEYPLLHEDRLTSCYFYIRIMYD